MTADRPGEHADFGVLLKRHDAKLRGLAYKMLGGDRHWMDDALQEAYLRAYRARDSLRNEDEAGTWLYRIVTNTCIDELRKGRRRPHPVDVGSATWERPSGATLPDDAVVRSDLVRRVLAALPDDQRATVVLVDGEGFDHTTAAEMLGVAPGTVASRLSRARQTMRDAIGEDR